VSRQPQSRGETGGIRPSKLLTLAAGAAALVLVVSACGGGDDGGGSGQTIAADGSSTVGPLTTKAAEDFKAQGGVDITVGISGTGGGFERFCRDETDISNASRPIKDEEAAACADAGIEYLEFTVATDALTNVVNAENDWADCLTVDQLKAIWEPGSKVDNWNEVDPSFPDEPLRLYGAGTDSGTFDYFTDAIVGEEGASRTDYNASEDDNVTVQGVSGERGGLGYFGFSYFEENEDRLKAVEVDGGSGCVGPSVPTAEDGSYAPLSRPLFVYVKRTSFDDDANVRDFVGFMLDNEQAIAEEARFVPLSDEQLAEQQSKFEDAVG
jgi:phosphate transport system substrate-binding protein